MSYFKHNFIPHEVLYASQLNEIEDQISLNESNILSKYTKPATGIPESDLSVGVREKLNSSNGGTSTNNEEAIPGLFVDISGIDYLPITLNESDITENMYVTYYHFSNPYAIKGDLSVITHNGSIDLFGNISGRTDIELLLVKVEDVGIGIMP